MRLFLFFFWALSPLLLMSQTEQISVWPTNEPIKIDGLLDETIWQQEVSHPPFWQYAPNDSIHAELRTEIRMAADDKFLYISSICYAKNKDYVIPSLRRDFRAGGNDNITFLIDPFNDRINAFMFGTNPYGVKREGLISGGGESLDGFSTSWDNKWRCEAKIHDDHWIAEMAIPLSTLRYNEGQTTWRFNCYRFDTQINERSTWVRIPRNQWIFNLAFMGEMQWKAAPTSKNQRLALIPYVSSNNDINYEEDGEWNFGANVGGDAKILVSSGLNLDLTINPDFSQVEVDQQITDLSRFELFFPERRQFFLENADLFSSFGNNDANPFFSRRIGISRDTLTGDNLLNPIYAGARLSGKINDKLRIGVLNMVTAPDPKTSLATYNYNVVSSQYRLWKRSNIGLIAVNKDAVANRELRSQDLYNRVLGVDFNLATNNNRWTMNSYVHRSFSQEQEDFDSWSHGVRLSYLKRRYNLRWAHQYIGSGYDPQVGFLPRKGYLQWNPRADVFFYQNDRKLNRINLAIESSFLFSKSLQLTDRITDFRLSGDFVNQARFDIRVQNSYIYLLSAWDPTGTNSIELPGENGYEFTRFQFSFNSNRALPLSFRNNLTIGQYYTGRRYGVGGSINYRLQPYANFELRYNYNIFQMPYLESNRSTVIFSPRIDISFTKKIFLTTALQYNSQSSNSNLNIRFQYRFAPVSDLFIVYTDNYFTDFENNMSPNYIDINSRNRALVLKCSYWLNL